MLLLFLQTLPSVSLPRRGDDDAHLAVLRTRQRRSSASVLAAAGVGARGRRREQPLPLLEKVIALLISNQAMLSYSCHI